MKKCKKLILTALLLSVLWIAGCGSSEGSSPFLSELLPLMQQFFTPEEMDLLTQHAADLGYSLEEYLKQEYEDKLDSPELCLEYLAQTIQEVQLNQKLLSSTPKPDEPKDVTKGKWSLKVYDPFKNYFEFFYEDGEMTQCDELFSKSGEEEEQEFYSFSGEELKELSYYEMNTEQILITLEEYGYTVHEWTEIE